MLIVSGTTVLNVDKVISIIINYTPEKEKVKVGEGFFGFFPEYQTKTVDKWTLKFDYICAVEKGRAWFTNGPSANYADLKEKARGIIEQVKTFDSSLVNAAFEEAFLKEK